jgi:methionyl-tRNA formyltransferase
MRVVESRMIDAWIGHGAAAARRCYNPPLVTRPRALFFGTPDFAVPCLDALASMADVACVVTQPDRPKGRGLELAPPPVKARALALGLPVMQPTKVRTAEFAAELRAFGADVALVVAYGRILTPAVLAAPRLGCLNVHASLLPRWRGAAPIQWAVASGDAESGVCLMQMDEGLDTGPVLARRVLPIGPNDTAAELAERLSQLGAELLREELPRYLAGALISAPQDAERMTLAPILQKTHGAIDWQKSAQQVHDLVRGMTPWPGAYTLLPSGATLKVYATRLVPPSNDANATPGTVLSADRAHGLVVACGEGAIALDAVQPEGKRRMTAAEYLAGRGLSAGEMLGAPGGPKERG